MDITRKIGIGIVMIVPAFVFGGALWAMIESWVAVLGLEVVMVIIYFLIISGKSSVTSQET
jgi:hypothetical protein